MNLYLLKKVEVFLSDLCLATGGLAWTHPMMGEGAFKTAAQDGRRPDMVMTYCMNNSTVGFVDENGEMFVAPASEAVVTALCESGYRPGSFWVPLSNGETLVEEHQERRWRSIVNFGSYCIQSDNERRHRRQIEEAAAKEKQPEIAG